ncbi:unnamed protein product [Pylaiella littoralis]
MSKPPRFTKVVLSVAVSSWVRLVFFVFFCLASSDSCSDSCSLERVVITCCLVRRLLVTTLLSRRQPGYRTACNRCECLHVVIHVIHFAPLVMADTELQNSTRYFVVQMFCLTPCIICSDRYS